jgi:hypothetical protein
MFSGAGSRSEYRDPNGSISLGSLTVSRLRTRPSSFALPERRFLTGNGSARARQRAKQFSWRSTAEKTLEAYRRVAARRASQMA